MIHRIQSVTAKRKYIIEAMFFNGETKQYDMRQLFSAFPQFKQFEKEKDLFKKVHVDEGGYAIIWNDDLDLDAETIWENGNYVETTKEPDLNHLLAYQLLLAREKTKMTQKELSEKTGIYQADISKLERGIGNPSLLTLKRLAEGLGMNVLIHFEENANIIEKDCRKWEESDIESARERAYEFGLPDYLQRDLDEYKRGLEQGSNLLDCLWGELYGSLNIAEINEGSITPEHADYLRKKYLWRS